jgi:hypothetical protein
MAHAVGIDFSTELNCFQKTFGHRLFGVVGGHVDLVVADVGLWQGLVVAAHRCYRVRVALFFYVKGHLRPAGHEL